MTAEQTLITAFDLAERILDELTRPDQNWLAIEHLASALAELAGRAAHPAAGAAEEPSAG
jgi:hypothetical protein